MTPERFEVDLDPATLDDLRERLHRTRWPTVIGEDDWRYGVPGSWLREVVRYWADEWSWRDQADRMNRHPHYRVEIDGVIVHYWHIPSRVADPIPIVLTHGWPWTFWDYDQVVDRLTHRFEVIVPSLPGFGFSTPLDRAGVDVASVADLWVALMRDVLGFDRFAAFGGDWGALVTAHLGHAHAEILLGAQMSLAVIPGVDRRSLEGSWADDERWMLDRMRESDATIRSHVAVHSLDPQTLAYGLADSPAACAAWLWERRRNWSDCGGVVESAFDRDFLCTLAALYWCTGAIESSLRIYHEHFTKPWPLAHDRHPVIEAPTGFAIFPKDVVMLPRVVAETETQLHRWSIMPRGGHFGPAEAPELVAAEIEAFFTSLDHD